MSRDDEEMLEGQAKAELSRWKRRQVDAEDAHEAAIRGMRKFLKGAIKEQGTHRNIATELRDYIRGIRQGTISTQGGFDGKYQDPDGVVSPEGISTVTGFGARPWENDDDDDGLF